jgi:hypothetical protein
MGILDGLKQAVVNALDPRRHESGEQEYVRNVYLNVDGNNNPRARSWSRIHSENGNCVGFSYTCSCGREFQLLSAFEWLRNYECPLCKDRFDLLRAVGITQETPIGKWEAMLRTLPVRPRLDRQSAPRVHDTWGDSSGEAKWEGPKPASVVGYR